jgi:hypothetical protein
MISHNPAWLGEAQDHHRRGYFDLPLIHHNLVVHLST